MVRLAPFQLPDIGGVNHDIFNLSSACICQWFQDLGQAKMCDKTFKPQSNELMNG
jgi:hypothetical protein